MGLDSVEIVLSWEHTFGIALDDSEVVGLRTPRQAIDLISAKLGASDTPSFCPSMRAFHMFRSGVRQVTGDRHRRVRLPDPLRDVFKGHQQREFWNKFGHATGIEGFRPPATLFRRPAVRDAIELLVARHLRWLLKPSETWTRSLVRSGVRAGVTDVVGAGNFSDDNRFIEDIGMD
jgi:hypothetical protein